MSDVVPFLRAWASDPMRVASVVPSGQALSRLITSEINPGLGPILELGPGTGVFTQALIERGIPPSRLVLVEFTAEFAVMLEKRYPDADVVCMDAARLRHMYWYAHRLAGAVVSGLPLLSMPPAKVLAILKGAFLHLEADGAFYQFTYGPRCPVPVRILDRLGLRAHSLGWAVHNLPPAQVFRITRADTNLQIFQEKREAMIRPQPRTENTKSCALTKR